MDFCFKVILTASLSEQIICSVTSVNRSLKISLSFLNSGFDFMLEKRECGVDGA